MFTRNTHRVHIDVLCLMYALLLSTLTHHVQDPYVRRSVLLYEQVAISSHSIVNCYTLTSIDKISLAHSLAHSLTFTQTIKFILLFCAVVACFWFFFCVRIVRLFHELYVNVILNVCVPPSCDCVELAFICYCCWFCCKSFTFDRNVIHSHTSPSYVYINIQTFSVA